VERKQNTIFILTIIPLLNLSLTLPLVAQFLAHYSLLPVLALILLSHFHPMSDPVGFSADIGAKVGSYIPGRD
jgi:hypothetical protein